MLNPITWNPPTQTWRLHLFFHPLFYDRYKLTNNLKTQKTPKKSVLIPVSIFEHISKNSEIIPLKNIFSTFENVSENVL